MKREFLATLSTVSLLCVTSNASAQIVNPPDDNLSTASEGAKFAKFAPKENSLPTKIDYAVWDEALGYFVFRMGKSLRESAPRPAPNIGTRRVYGHESRYRMEGNRVIFSFLNDDIKQSLTDYRKDLEQTAGLIDISKLAKNEQLAFWTNLHNAAVIEQIALAYPVSQPSKIRVGDSQLPLDETPFISVAGVQMSPKDIRTKIVYPNWKNPKVIYGFFRGEIGGPSIQGDAFTGDNVSNLLDKSGREFVNSLRGTQKNGSSLLVSKIYEEAAPFYFRNWQADIKNHLLGFSNDRVTPIIERSSDVKATIYETDVSDLANGERDPNYTPLASDMTKNGVRIPRAVVRLLAEHEQKMQKIIKRNGLQGRVTVIDVGDVTKPKEPSEIE